MPLSHCPGFDPSILRHSGIWGAADEAVLNIVHKKKNPKNPLLEVSGAQGLTPPVLFLPTSFLYSKIIADPWHFGVDPDPDPRIHASDSWIRIRIPHRIRVLDPDPAMFVIDLQDDNKKLIFVTKILLFTFYFLMKSRFFLIFLNDDRRIRPKNIRIRRIRIRIRIRYTKIVLFCSDWWTRHHRAQLLQKLHWWKSPPLICFWESSLMKLERRPALIPQH